MSKWTVETKGSFEPVKRHLELVSDTHVVVGFPRERVRPEIADRAHKNETGRGVPRRSFLAATVDGKLNEYFAQLGSLVRAAVDSRNPVNLWREFGRRMAYDFKRAIVVLRAPPNARATLRQKQGTNPLIDTGEMRDSLTYVVRSGQPTPPEGDAA